MKTIKSISLIALFCMLGSASFGQNEADAVLGVWLTSDKDAKMKIYKCGSEYCGKLYWLEEPNKENGEPKRDKENPEPELRNRKLLGLEIMTKFVYDEDYEWEDGEIYDPESGNTYSCIMELSKDGKTLNVRGYIGISLFGRTETWTRVNE